MKRKMHLVVALALSGAFVFAAEPDKTPSQRHITVQEAVQLALRHNHVVRIAGFQVEEKQHAKDVARSSYFPTLRNDSSVRDLTDTEFIAIPAGSLGIAANTPIPGRTVVLNQGTKTSVTSGTQLTQPLTQYFKFKPQNDVARADLNATRDQARQKENDVALKVHQIYYQLLIAQLHRSATLSRIKASDDLQAERVQQVKYGSVLQEDLIDSRAQNLQAKQELLSTELQISDLTIALNDAIGLPLKTQLSLDPNIPPAQSTCRLEECIQVALDSYPEVLEARQAMVKVSEELVALREESSRVAAHQLEQGVALKSQADSAAAQELDARTSLLQSQLDYIQAQDEVTHAIGRTPE